MLVYQRVKSPSIYGDGIGMLLKLGLANHDGETRVSHDYPLRGEARNPWVFLGVSETGCFHVCVHATYVYMYIYLNYTHILIPKKDRIDMFFKLFIPSHGYCPLLI